LDQPHSLNQGGVMNKTCKWTQGFDGKWIVGCTKEKQGGTFERCPFCGKRIEWKVFNVQH